MRMKIQCDWRCIVYCICCLTALLHFVDFLHSDSEHVLVLQRKEFFSFKLLHVLSDVFFSVIFIIYVIFSVLTNMWDHTKTALE